MKYRKLPIEIEAMRLSRATAEEVARWCGGHVSHQSNPSDPSDIWTGVAIPTLEGVMTAQLGDWVIKGVKGEFYPCQPDIFAATYELVGEGVPA